MGRLARPHILAALGALWIIVAFAENDPALVFMGISLASGSLSLALTGMRSSSTAKRLAEILLLIMSIGAVLIGYALTGSSLLMALMLAILALALLSFSLSFGLPRLRRA